MAPEVEIKAVVELQLDTGFSGLVIPIPLTIIINIERLVDVALTVAADHLALDVVIQPVGRLADLYVLRIAPARVAARTAERLVLIEEHLFHIGDGDMLHPREILVGIDFGRLRRIEIIIAPRNRKHHGQHGT